MRLLCLYLSVGAGHVRVAESVAESVRRKYPRDEVFLVDVLEHVSPFINSLVVNSYVKSLKGIPALYSKIYKFSRDKTHIISINKSLGKLILPKLKSLVDKINPTVVLCSHMFTAYLASELISRYGYKFPIINIVTDFIVHPFWIQEHAHAYIVANQPIKNIIAEMGVPENNVYPFGIPVSEQLLKSRPREDIIKEFNLKDKPTLLVIGGGLGLGKIYSTFVSLASSKSDFQIIVVAGKNIKLKYQLNQYLEQNASYNKKNIRVFGFIENIQDIMQISDIIITKPGGITMSEALAKNIATVMTPPVPGPEETNFNFLINNGIALGITNSHEIADTISDLMAHPEKIENIRKSSLPFSKPRSSEDTADLAIRLSGSN